LSNLLWYEVSDICRIDERKNLDGYVFGTANEIEDCVCRNAKRNREGLL